MNTIVLMGRLARDPETKLASTQKGQTKVSRFPLVVKRNRTSKAFVVMITAYGNNAEFVEKYLEKGIKIALSGELVISQIKDEQTGTASYYTEVIMDDVEFAEAKTKKEESDGFQPAEKRKIPFDIPEELEQERLFTGILQRLGLEDTQRILNSYPFTLSGGMLQRLMIAAALMCQPSLLVSDEATTAIDK